MSWKVIQGMEGRYAVSDGGEVMSMDYRGSGLPGILKPSIARGYLSVEMAGRRFTVHRLVAAAFLGDRPPGMQINHINGIKTDNRASNLEYCTPSENMKHCFATGLQSNKGERHSQARLTDNDIREIRSMLARGLTQDEIALNFGIFQSVVSRIKHGKAWAHVAQLEGGVL